MYSTGGKQHNTTWPSWINFAISAKRAIIHAQKIMHGDIGLNLYD